MVFLYERIYRTFQKGGIANEREIVCTCLLYTSWQMKKADTELENAKNIRFITSSYEDRFKIPDGSAVEIEYPNRKFSARCEYMLSLIHI